jgi:glutaminase
MPQRSGEDDVAALIGHYRAVVSPLRAYLKELHERYRAVEDGVVADYIPELSSADPAWFGLAVATADGRVFDVGDCEQTFTVQSVSKPFVYALALEEHGRERVLERIGVEPTGDPFNSIGAIAAASLVPGSGPVERLRRVLETFSRFTGREMTVDMAVFTSERATGHRNRAIAYLMLNFGMMPPDLEDALDLYFKQCSILVTARDLAVMGATLANGGVNPVTGERAMAAEHVRDVLSLMLTCGMYDYAGEWAYKVGLPAKSGVSGGILAVVPGQAGIGLFSPPLDEHGNSVRGIRACEALSERFGLHIFDSRQAEHSLAAAIEPHGGAGRGAGR